MRSPLIRHEKNPIISPEDMPFEAYSVFNAGAVYFNDRFLMLLRVEKYDRKTYFHTAISEDGVNFDINPDPINYPLTKLEEDWGGHRFDMRITRLDGTYYVCHASWTKFGSCSAMAKTDDFINFEPVGSIPMPSNRNSVLFPEKINGLYVRIDRPQNINGSGSMWINYSPDLVYWGNAKPLKIPDLKWGGRKNGAGAVPIKTNEGWLEIYHATCHTASTENYYLGAMLLDLDDPSIVIKAPEQFILAAEKDYECVGQVPNVVFTAGAVQTDDGKLNIYYGGADTRMCLAQTTVNDLVEFCMQNG